MILFPNSKINLGLHILDKRPDGYHNIETIFYPVPIKDGLEIIQSSSGSQRELSTSGLAIDGDNENNLCNKAYTILKNDFPNLPAVKMHLHKTIPMGAGLGGGSSDGAHTLIMLNAKFSLGLSQDQLVDYAAQLGSDCPFFVANAPAFAQSRGEVLTGINLDLSAYKMILVHPGIHVNTAWAFSQVTPIATRTSLKEIITLPVAEWRTALANDFEAPVFKEHPEIQKLKDWFYTNGAIYAAMTGSGSSVFGLFQKGAIPAFAFPENYSVLEPN
jgi:4-diphosphocytidyl-2-C-methyl-D-erythritol kinase